MATGSRSATGTSSPTATRTTTARARRRSKCRSSPSPARAAARATGSSASTGRSTRSVTRSSTRRSSTRARSSSSPARPPARSRKARHNRRHEAGRRRGSAPRGKRAKIGAIHRAAARRAGRAERSRRGADMYEQSAPPTSSAWFGPTLDTGTLLGQTMELVAITTGVFALGAYLGRDLSYGWGFAFFLAAFGCLIGMRATVKSANSGAAIGLLFAFGLLIGFGTGPTIAYYASADPTAVWQAGAATAPFHAGGGGGGVSAPKGPVPRSRRLAVGAPRPPRVLG